MCQVLLKQKESVFEALRPLFLSLACRKYAVHLVKKLLDNASKKQLQGFISSLHGHVAFLLRHTIGSTVVGHAFQLANGSQRQYVGGIVLYRSSVVRGLDRN